MGKTNVLLNLIKHQRPDIDKIYLYVKDSFEWKSQLLIDRTQKVGIKKLESPKGLIDYSQIIEDVHKKLENYKPIKKKRFLSVWWYDVRYER